MQVRCRYLIDKYLIYLNENLETQDHIATIWKLLENETLQILQLNKKHNLDLALNTLKFSCQKCITEVTNVFSY